MSQNINEELIKNAQIKAENEEDNEDDILSDVRNLFIEEKEEAEAEIKKPIESAAPKTPEVQVQIPPVKSAEPRIIFESKKEAENKSPETSEKKKTNQQKTTTSQKIESTCKSNSDCDENSYCLLKSGKCLGKLQIGQSGCTSNDQCSDSVCLVKKCTQACGNDSDCADGESCSMVKNSNIFKGLKAENSFKGICKSDGKMSVEANDSKESSKSPSIALISVFSIVSLIVLIAGCIYLRGRLRRRNRNNNPDLFLFNKLQRSASQNGLSKGPGSNGSVALSDQLNAKLSNAGGARFTRWTVLSEEE